MVFIRFTCNSQALATQLKLGNDRISFELQSLYPDLHSESHYSKNVHILYSVSDRLSSRYQPSDIAATFSVLQCTSL